MKDLIYLSFTFFITINRDFRYNYIFKRSTNMFYVIKSITIFRLIFNFLV